MEPGTVVWLEKIRFLQGVASAQWDYQRGDVIEEADGIRAKSWLKGVIAERVADDVPIGRAPAGKVCPWCQGTHMEFVTQCAYCRRPM